jgi:uncharacterized protein YbaR (Trm112 family)
MNEWSEKNGSPDVHASRPLTKCPLEYHAEEQELISRAAKLAYPIRDGIPIMLPEEARRLD